MSPTRSGPSIDTEADRFEGRQPCSPSEPGCRMFSIDKGRAMAGRQVPWQHVPSPVDEALVVAPTGLNVRLGAGVRHRSEGRRRAGAPRRFKGVFLTPCWPLCSAVAARVVLD